ncbi:unnamed protein product [Amoebophrya sp. A120]|nr:unnamed protein product [Amoebophrya sp. A120]|eukprot:GSA120T00000031001.1
MYRLSLLAKAFLALRVATCGSRVAGVVQQARKSKSGNRRGSRETLGGASHSMATDVDGDKYAFLEEAAGQDSETVDPPSQEELEWIEMYDIIGAELASDRFSPESKKLLEKALNRLDTAFNQVANAPEEMREITIANGKDYIAIVKAAWTEIEGALQDPDNLQDPDDLTYPTGVLKDRFVTAFWNKVRLLGLAPRRSADSFPGR